MDGIRIVLIVVGSVLFMGVVASALGYRKARVLSAGARRRAADLDVPDPFALSALREENARLGYDAVRAAALVAVPVRRDPAVGVDQFAEDRRVRLERQQQGCKFVV